MPSRRRGGRAPPIGLREKARPGALESSLLGGAIVALSSGTNACVPLHRPTRRGRCSPRCHASREVERRALCATLGMSRQRSSTHKLLAHLRQLVQRERLNGDTAKHLAWRRPIVLAAPAYQSLRREAHL
eukprot:6682522-Prymnesium_polylepis.2